MNEINRYGIIGTVLWFLLILAAFTFANSMAVGVYAGIANADFLENLQPGQYEEAFLAYALNGTAVAIAGIASACLCLLLIYLAIKIKKATLADYLSLQSLHWASYGKWIASLILFLVLIELIYVVAGVDSGSQVMRDIYSTASPKWLFWIAIIIFAPLFEETLFRGFVYDGLARSAIGVPLTIVITSAIWAAIHLQYEWHHMLVIFVFGIIFGIARHLSGSLYLPIALHMVVNLLASFDLHFAA